MEWLGYKHMEIHPWLLDDDIPDHFDGWVSYLSIEEIAEFAEEWHHELCDINNRKEGEV